MGVTFDYDDWNDNTDLLLAEPGSLMGFAAINTALDVGDMPTVRQRQRATLIRETEDGVIGLIAGGLEWLRSRGLSAAEVENKVRVYKANNLAHADQVQLAVRANRQAVELISNPRDWQLEDTVVIG